MRLNIVSWNIRHLRWKKVEDYLEGILKQVDAAHVMFFYENKQRNEIDGLEFIDKIHTGLMDSNGTGSSRVAWRASKCDVGTREYVWVVYSSSCRTGPKSKFGEGQTFTLALERQERYDKRLKSAMEDALTLSRNATVEASRTMKQDDYRIPAVVHLTLTKPDGSTKLIRVAAWHAPGPAKGCAALLNSAFQTCLKDIVDLFIGDFNMTGLGTDPRTVNLPMRLHRTNASTTITKEGPVDHEEGFDLVYRNDATLSDGSMATGVMIGRAAVSVVPKPELMSYEEAFKISDHRPVMITIKGL